MNESTKLFQSHDIPVSLNKEMIKVINKTVKFPLSSDILSILSNF